VQVALRTLPYAAVGKRVITKSAADLAMKSATESDLIPPLRFIIADARQPKVEVDRAKWYEPRVGGFAGNP